MTAGKTDTNVTGTISGAANAVKVSVAPVGCTITLGGSTTASFNEVTNELSLTGSGLTVASASLTCGGATAPPDALTMNSVKFALGGDADFS